MYRYQHEFLDVATMSYLMQLIWPILMIQWLILQILMNVKVTTVVMGRV